MFCYFNRLPTNILNVFASWPFYSITLAKLQPWMKPVITLLTSVPRQEKITKQQKVLSLYIHGHRPQPGELQNFKDNVLPLLLSSITISYYLHTSLHFSNTGASPSESLAMPCNLSSGFWAHASPFSLVGSLSLHICVSRQSFRILF